VVVKLLRKLGAKDLHAPHCDDGKRDNSPADGPCHNKGNFAVFDVAKQRQRGEKSHAAHEQARVGKEHDRRDQAQKLVHRPAHKQKQKSKKQKKKTKKKQKNRKKKNRKKTLKKKKINYGELLPSANNFVNLFWCVLGFAYFNFLDRFASFSQASASFCLHPLSFCLLGNIFRDIDKHGGVTSAARM
jgi:hypothetical protein